MTLEKLLELHSLSIELLDYLSYRSELGISLKTDLGDVDKDLLFNDILKACDYINNCLDSQPINIDYRVKAYDSIKIKYERYYPNREIRKVFNDLLSFRTLCENYEDILSINDKRVHIVDLSEGKTDANGLKIDDGYRGVHVSYRKASHYYPIEIQFNTFYDRGFNNYLHDYLYKKDYPKEIGGILRKQYEEGKIKNSDEFKEALNHVLLSREKS